MSIKKYASIIVFGLLFLVKSAFAQSVPHVVAFGLWDGQKVFDLEARRGAAILRRSLGGPAPIIRVNTPGHAGANFAGVESAFDQTARHMNRQKDILVLLVTSHGNEHGVAAKIGDKIGIMPPKWLKGKLDRSGFANRIIIVSACYSGIFADEMADEHTLVITAADALHPSFGCSATAQWTYFGEAFFYDSLARGLPLTSAFEAAKAEIYSREETSGFDHSNPQMRGGEQVLPLLSGR